jgi:hypothetical protein
MNLLTEVETKTAAPTSEPGAASTRCFLVALAALSVVFAFGAVVARNVDFDVTFGIESWRSFGAAALLVVAGGGAS